MQNKTIEELVDEQTKIAQIFLELLKEYFEDLTFKRIVALLTVLKFYFMHEMEIEKIDEKRAIEQRSHFCATLYQVLWLLRCKLMWKIEEDKRDD